MDPAVNKRSQGHWGHADRAVYQYPFGDYVTRGVSGYGQEGGAPGYSGTALIVGILFGFISGQVVERTVLSSRGR